MYIFFYFFFYVNRECFICTHVGEGKRQTEKSKLTNKRKKNCIAVLTSVFTSHHIGLRCLGDTNCAHHTGGEIKSEQRIENVRQ